MEHEGGGEGRRGGKQFLFSHPQPPMDISNADADDVTFVGKLECFLEFNGASTGAALVQRHQNAHESAGRERDVVLVEVRVQMENFKAKLIGGIDHELNWLQLLRQAIIVCDVPSIGNYRVQ